MNATIRRLHFTNREEGDVLVRAVLDEGAHVVFVLPRAVALAGFAELATELRKTAPEAGDGDVWWCPGCHSPLRGPQMPDACPHCGEATKGAA